MTPEIFVPLNKVEAANRLVIGRIAQEVPDRAGEVLDYEGSKAAFLKWSAEAERDSRGLSKGNVRVMHRRDIAAGNVRDIIFNDLEKAIDVVVEVTDNDEWRKCEKGTYVGFSIGGGYERKWRDADGHTRYIPRLSEVSLVDRPCIPTATFAELVKADGTVGRLELRGAPVTFGELWREATPPRTFGELLKAAG